jgi:hypothetical protein
MAFLVGGGVAITLRVLGVASARARAVHRVHSVHVARRGDGGVSGLGLLAGYPAKALTNWIFALKFACLIGAALLIRRLRREAFPIAARGEACRRAPLDAAASLALWFGGVACGKLLLYTNHLLFTPTSGCREPRTARRPDLRSRRHRGLVDRHRHLRRDVLGVGLAGGGDRPLHRAVPADGHRRHVRPEDDGPGQGLSLSALHRLVPFGCSASRCRGDR